MRVLLSKICNKLSTYLARVSKSLYTPLQEERCIPWFRDNGDKTLRLNYDLDDKSVVFDLGGYEGQWASDIFSMYCCYIYVFEPVENFANLIKKRFSKNTKIFVHNFGLSNLTQRMLISIDADSSSTFKIKNSAKEIYLIKAIDFIKEHKIEHIDLMKINIEGGEYDLLEHLLDSGFIQNIYNIQVQFHDFLPDAVTKMAKVQEQLSKSHFLTYQYLFVWENWTIKNQE